MIDLLATLAFAGVLLLALLSAVHLLKPRTVVVRDHEEALLRRNGRALRTLGAGSHRLWWRHTELTVVDLRERCHTVSGQEVLTRDGVALKLSLSVFFRLRGAHEVESAVSWFDLLHAEVQHALRDAAGAVELEALLAQRSSIDAGLTEAVRAAAEPLGVEVRRAAVKDLMVGGELKRALAEVARARAEASARLERTRGETASMRNLLNAARLLEEHAGLAQLRLLEVAQAAASNPANTLVLGLRAERGVELGG